MPKYKRVLVLFLAIKTEPVVLKTDCIIPIGANQVSILAVICHCGPKTQFTNGTLRTAIPDINGADRKSTTKVQFK
ncbi:hypothetical protein MS6016_50360 [Klebsiella variicola]|nr:hypothetical protein MS6016_50360 [Klebsiella variicola]